MGPLALIALVVACIAVVMFPIGLFVFVILSAVGVMAVGYRVSRAKRRTSEDDVEEVW